MKTAKTYRFTQETLENLEQIINYWSEELLQSTPGTRKVAATSMIEFLINQEFKRIQSQEEQN